MKPRRLVYPSSQVEHVAYSASVRRLLLIVFAICYAAPGIVLQITSYSGTLPWPLSESNEFLPATFQLLWFVPALSSLMVFRARRICRRAVFTTIFLTICSALSLLTALALSLPAAEAWLPLASAALAVFPFALMPTSQARAHLRFVLLCNLLTLPMVLLGRSLSGDVDFRLNAFGLNANSSGLIFALWWLLLQAESRIPALRPKPWLLRCITVGAFVAVLSSGSRTALALVLVGMLANPQFRRLLSWRALLIAAGVILVAVIALDRSFEGERYGQYTPPEILLGTGFETFGATGRAWSLMVGLDVLRDSGVSGTQSVMRAVEEIRARGYPTFSHSTLMMFLILYGWVGLMLTMGVLIRLRRIRVALTVRMMLIVMFVLSGGLITNPKEIALCAMLLAMWPPASARSTRAAVGRSQPEGGSGKVSSNTTSDQFRGDV
jgi:hypothetical protein